MSVDFYIRVFIRVFEQPSEVKRSLLKTAYVLQSSQTSSFYLQPVGVTRNNNFYGAPFTSPSACQETNGRLIIGGKKYIYGKVNLIKKYNIHFTLSLLFYYLELFLVSWSLFFRCLQVIHFNIGPIWSDPIHQQDVVEELRDRIEAYEKDVNVVENTGLLITEQLYPPATRKRMLGLLTSMSEELKDVPLYYYLPDLVR